MLLGLSLLISVLILIVESSNPSARIQTLEQSLWWTVTTITGVGYGDFFPITTAGRILGGILEISGVVMFGLIIGIIGITMSNRQEEYLWFRLFERIDRLEQSVAMLNKKNDHMIQSATENSATKKSNENDK